MSWLSIAINTVVFGLILSFLVIIHELGHFLVARWKKIKVEEFGLGYPPRAKTLFTKWGTVFSLNWVPFGGFVQMEGENEVVEPIVESTKATTRKRPKLPEFDSIGPFYTKSASARLMVILAGAAVNILFGVLAFAIVFSILGIPAGARITEIESGSPAEQAHLQPEMVITGLHAQGTNYQIRSTQEVAALVGAHYGQTVAIDVDRVCQTALCGDVQQFDVTLRSADQVSAEKGGLGIRQADFSQFYPWYEMPIRGVWFGVIQAVTLGVLIIQSLATMVTDLITSAIVPQEVMGPVGIVYEASKQDLASQGLLSLLLFAGLISINLGIMNILPIPALDGGRALFILLEKIVGKYRIARVESYANYGGFVFLIGLIVLITARDIFRIVVGG